MTPRDIDNIDIQSVVAGLRAERERWRLSVGRPLESGGRELPSPDEVARIVEGLRAALFPMRLGPPDLRQETEDSFVAASLRALLAALAVQVRLELRHAALSRHLRGDARDEARDDASEGPADIDARTRTIVTSFAAELPAIRRLLDADVEAAYHGDPAARSFDEVLLCYPGVRAMTMHRLAHALYRLDAPLIARLIGEKAHAETGIDIHPGASIGAGCFIDHGTGVVIGETAVIGEQVRLYQQVTLGAKRFPKDDKGHLQKGLPRHPIVEDDVVIYAGATILGRVTIGRGATIGGNVWLTRSVPAGANITQASSQQEIADAAPGP
jgi:serine O-acetyltransferase